MIYSFNGRQNTGDGAGPTSGIIVENNRNLFGTTSIGGANDNGTIFEIPAGGTEAVIYQSSGSPGDGAHPEASLIADNRGNLYGTTVDGGTSRNCGNSGCGTLFRLTGRGFVP